MNNWLFQRIEQELASCQLSHWAEELVPIIQGKFDSNGGNLRHFVKLLQKLPKQQGWPLSFSEGSVCAGQKDAAINGLEQLCKELKPWRKGPFTFTGTHIDSEWQCQKKWHRLQPMIDIDGCRVLDVGGGNGYFAWLFLDAGAEAVVVVDPSPLYWAQFQLARRLIEPSPIAMLPVTLESLPNEDRFDLVVCMGVLYHSPAPFSLIKALRERVTAHGFLILETLVIDGDESTVLVPSNRYASMKNVYAIPSIKATIRWLERCALEVVDVGEAVVTSNEEQRTTQWSNQKSLSDFLDPNDSTKTIEGYPAPKRMIIKAKKKNN